MMDPENLNPVISRESVDYFPDVLSDQLQQYSPQQLTDRLKQAAQPYKDQLQQYSPQQLTDRLKQAAQPYKDQLQRYSPQNSLKQYRSPQGVYPQRLKRQAPRNLKNFKKVGRNKVAKTVGKFAGKKVGKLALGPIGLAIDWIPYISKCFLFSVASNYLLEPNGADWRYIFIMIVSAMTLVNGGKDVIEAFSQKSNLIMSALMVLPRIFWMFFYGTIVFFYGIPRKEPVHNALLTFIKSSSVFLSVIYGILSGIIPLILLGTIIPGLNFLVIPLGYIVNIAGLFL